MKIEINYDVYCDDEWVAGADSLDEAMGYAKQYRKDGRVEVYEVENKSTLVFKGSKIKKASEK